MFNTFFIILFVGIIFGVNLMIIYFLWKKSMINEIHKILDDKFINSIKDQMPELPERKTKRFIEDYQLTEYDANVLTVDLNLANFFEEVSSKTKNPKFFYLHG